MTTATDDLLTIAEVQSFLRVSRATIYQMMATRGLPAPSRSAQQPMAQERDRELASRPAPRPCTGSD